MFSFDKIYTTWSLERLSRHVFYWLLWLLFFAMVNSNYQEESFWSWVQVELVVMTIKLPFTYFVIYYLVPRYLIKKEWLAFAIFAGLLAIVGGMAISALDIYIISPIIFGENQEHFWTMRIGFKIVDLIYIASLPTIIKLLQSYIQQEKQTRQITEEKLNAELQLLKNQLQPHFLFNTLNNLYGMVLTQDKKSPQVVLRLSEIMNYMLYESDRNSIALEKEIEHLNNYIELERIRHGKRLDLVFEKSGTFENKRIAPLLLLPFVENAFKHGVENNGNPTWIRMNVWVNEQSFEFMVENALPEHSEQPSGQPTTLGGIGLQNVKKRLALLYPERHHLTIRNMETYFVKLRLEL